MEPEEDIVGDGFEILEPPAVQPKQYFPSGDVVKVEKDEQDEETSPRVLDPEHPLLAKFQRALKEHLERQIYHLNDEISELETGSKKKTTEREQLGIDVYDIQQVVSKQQNDLEQCLKDIQNLDAAREQIGNELAEALELHRKDRQKLFESEQKEIELRNEVEGMNLLLQQMSKWEDDIESELQVNQRVFEKTKKDKVRLAEEKRAQDMMVYKLMTEVWKLEGELETMNMQLRVKEEERQRFAETIAYSNTEIEASEAEHRCLIHGWNSVIVAISSRDKHYNMVNVDLLEHNEKLRSIIAEIEQVKKLCNYEMNRNESLTMFRGRIEADIKNTMHQLDVEINKRENLERAMMQTQTILEQIEKDFQRVSAENHHRNRELSLIIRDFEKLTIKKGNVEEEILVKLQDQITNDKATKYLAKMVRDLKTKNRDLEVNLANIENTNAKVLMDAEGQKAVNHELQKVLDEALKQLGVVDKEVIGYDDEIAKCKSASNKKQREIDILTMKAEKLASRCGEKSPHELKISALEQHIEHTLETIKDLQKFWLREQGNVVNLSEQRQEQMHDSNLLRKQIMILEQRNLKINDELAGHKKSEDNMTRSINKLQNQLGVFQEALNKKKGSKQYLDEDNGTLQNEFLAKLKDAELSVAKLESDITEIEEDIIVLTEEVLEKNREALAWEKKWQMTVETKKNIDIEKGSGGEVGNMRAEIHRMEVRHGQLKKAQEKLIVDLEYCVARRDSIVTNAEAREKRIQGTQARVIFNRKLDDARNKIKQMQDDNESINEKMENLLEEEANLKREIETITEDITTVKNRCLDAQNDIDMAKTDKQMNLEMLLIKQRKLKIYSELAKGRQPFLMYKTDSALSDEYEKQNVLNCKLQNIVDNLMTDFPTHYYTFKRLLNTLKLPTISL